MLEVVVDRMREPDLDPEWRGDDEEGTWDHLDGERAVHVNVGNSGYDVAVSVRTRVASDDLLVFMHGLGCAKGSFDGAFEADCLRDFSICVFDFPSHGLSGALPAGAAPLTTCAGIVNTVIERLSPRRVHLVCHSMGGAVGLIAAQVAHNLAMFINVEGNLIGQDCGLVSRQIAEQPVEQFQGCGFVRLVEDLEVSGRRDLQAWGRWLSRCEPSGLHALARSLVEWSDSGQLLRMFLDLPRRAYVYGADSELDYLLPALGGTPCYAVPCSGHFPMVDNPHEFYELLGRILGTAGTIDEAEAAADELTEQLQGWDREPKSVAPDAYTQTAVYLGERRDV